MDLESIAGILRLQVRCGGEQMKTDVRGGYVGDLLSDVMANSSEGDLWITRQIHHNIVAVATLKDHAGVVLVHGSEPTKETLDKAVAEGLPVLVSDRSGFEVAGELYNLLRKGNA